MNSKHDRLSWSGQGHFDPVDWTSALVQRSLWQQSLSVPIRATQSLWLKSTERWVRQAYIQTGWSEETTSALNPDKPVVQALLHLWRQQQQRTQMRPALEAPTRLLQWRKEELPSPTTAANIHLMSPGLPNAYDPHMPQCPGTWRAHASVGDSLPQENQQTRRGGALWTLDGLHILRHRLVSATLHLPQGRRSQHPR